MQRLVWLRLQGSAVLPAAGRDVALASWIVSTLPQPEAIADSHRACQDSENPRSAAWYRCMVITGTGCGYYKLESTDLLLELRLIIRCFQPASRTITVLTQTAEFLLDSAAPVTPL